MIGAQYIPNLGRVHDYYRGKKKECCRSLCLDANLTLITKKKPHKILKISYLVFILENQRLYPYPTKD